jgi:DNA-binding FadR family transcriptional regulator
MTMNKADAHDDIGPWPVRSPLKAPKLGDRIYEQIVERIVSGALAEGVRLPSEHDFCRMFEVSRPVVREALARLRADGIIDSRQGSGSYVRRRPSRDILAYAPSGNISALLRCFEFRIALEGEAAALAATRRNADQLKAIRKAHDKFEQTLKDGKVGKTVDLEFHMAIARASGNELFAETMESLIDDIGVGMDMARTLDARQTRERILIVCQEHDAIMSALEDGDADRARVAMRAHIGNAQRRVVGQT